MMGGDPRERRAEAGFAFAGFFLWLGLLAVACFFLFFYAPKIEASWMDRGVKIPPYLVPIFVMSRQVPALLIGGVILIYFLSRRRD